MVYIYSILLIIFSVISLPFLFVKGKLHRGILYRFCITKNILKDVITKKIIWVHGVSVGEISLSKPIIEVIREQYPASQLIFSTITKTGNILAKKYIAKNAEQVIYFPFDLKGVVKKFLDRIRPSVVMLLETEIWPNFIYECHRRNIPVLLINGRISDGAFKRYMVIQGLLQHVLEKISLFCMQDEISKAKIITLGAPQERVAVVGNIKFDVTLDEQYVPEKLVILKEYLRARSRKFFIAGSTHPKEEEKLISVFKKIRQEYPRLFFLIAPRHIERSHNILKEVIRYGFKGSLYSSLGRALKEDEDVLILDVIGELRYLYGLADVVFIGGSLVPHGGQNLIEPAVFGKPILVGPYMDNFKDVTKIFLDSDAVIQVKDEDGLYKALLKLLHNPQIMETVGRNAKEVVSRNRGIAMRLMNFIKPYVEL
ncbi:MAG: 3-deoxy-D-manno-octulosonic acid transferase [Candidatus Omnitrophota bacterium]